MKNKMSKQNPVVTVDMVGHVQSLLPGATFRWPKGITLKALADICTIALPKALLDGSAKLGSILIADDNIDFVLSEKESNLFFIRLKKGMSATLTKSSEAILIPNFSSDYEIKQFEISRLE